MTLRQLYITTILIFASVRSLGQVKEKALIFPECDTLKYIELEGTLSSEIKSTDDQITKWLNKNSSGKKLNASAEFWFVLSDKKGVCCKKLILFDSTNTHTKDLVVLVLKLTEYPEFKQLAQNASKPKLLTGFVFYDREKDLFKIGLNTIILEK